MIYGINLGSLFRELPLAYEITAVIRVTIFTFLLSSVFSTIVAVTILRETMWRINHGVNFGSFFPTLISEALDVVIILSFFDYFLSLFLKSLHFFHFLYSLALQYQELFGLLPQSSQSVLQFASR